MVDEPNEPERIAAIARKLGKRARVMLRVTVGVHAGGHEYISTAHEDQKFGVPLLAAGADAAVLDVLNNLTDVTPAATNARIAESDVNAGNDHPQSTTPIAPASGSGKPARELRYDVKYPYDLSHEEVSDTDKVLAAAMEAIADGPSIAVLKTILANQDVLELVGAHSHIGSNIHDADAFIHAAKRMMLLRKTCGPPTPTSCPKSISVVVTPWPTPTAKIPWTSMWSSLVWPARSATQTVLWACPPRPSASSPAVTSWLQPA